MGIQLRKSREGVKCDISASVNKHTVFREGLCAGESNITRNENELCRAKEWRSALKKRALSKKELESVIHTVWWCGVVCVLGRSYTETARAEKKPRNGEVKCCVCCDMAASFVAARREVQEKVSCIYPSLDCIFWR